MLDSLAFQVLRLLMLEDFFKEAFSVIRMCWGLFGIRVTGYHSKSRPEKCAFSANVLARL